MIFSGSTAGGSGGRRSLRLPLRSRRAAAARSCAAILMGLEMVAARRRAGAAIRIRCYCARAANSVSSAASPPGSGAGRRAVYVAALLDDRSINRKQSHALIDGQERPRPAHGFAELRFASVLRPLARARS